MQRASPSKPSRLRIGLACSLHGILSSIGLENPNSRSFLSVIFVRSQPRFAIYSRLCSRNEEAFGEGTRAQHADSSNEGGDALKTKCVFSREEQKHHFMKCRACRHNRRALFRSAAQGGRIEDKACASFLGRLRNLHARADNGA
jgi:hypothetical protein